MRGVVTDRASGSPLPGVTVSAKSAGDSLSAGATFTDLSGRYLIRSLAVGNYLISFSSVGYRRIVDAPVAVGDSSDVTFDAAMEEIPLDLDEVIVSASRKEEKAVRAPSSTSIIDAATIASRSAVTPVDHLRSTGGIDIAQTGLMQQTVVTRAFNNVFSTTLTMMTDNRIAAVASLRANIPAFIPLVDDDLDRIEVVRGPASALYGPNAHNGVVNFITRSPFASKGTTISLAGGSSSLVQASVRHAGTAGERFGYKISAQYFRGRDWEYVDSTEVFERQEALLGGADPDTLRIGRREAFVERFGGEARMDYILATDATVNLIAGLNQAVSTIELTDIGASQGRDWMYGYLQSRLTVGSFFLQGFINLSDAGDSYMLRTGMPVVDRSRMIVAQAQHRYEPGERQLFTYGVDLQLTRPVTDGTITGRNEDDDDIDEFGAYLQSETRLLPGMLDLVLAARGDHNNHLGDIVVSPRAALVYTPAEEHNLRITWNRAYSTPNTTELFLDIVAEPNVFGFPGPYAVDLRGSGIPDGGYVFARDDNGRPVMHSTLNADRSLPMSVDDVALLWPTLVQVLTGYGIDLTGVPAPAASDIGSAMGLLDPAAGSFNPTGDVADVPRLEATITSTVEVGYKGRVGESLIAGLDVYHTTVTNFIGQFEVITPSVFMDRADVRTYLQTNGLSATEASLYASIISSLPLGTVTPQGVADPTALLVTPRNFGNLGLWGADLSLEFLPHPSWQVIGTVSVISKNFFENLDGVGGLALNSPEHRGTFTLRYRDVGGSFHAEARSRWMSGFRMSSGVYAGDVLPYTLFDLNAGAALPWFPGTALTLSVLNLLDRKHREFVGAPDIGRLVVGKIHYTI